VPIHQNFQSVSHHSGRPGSGPTIDIPSLDNRHGVSSRTRLYFSRPSRCPFGRATYATLGDQRTSTEKRNRKVQYIHCHITCFLKSQQLTCHSYLSAAAIPTGLEGILVELSTDANLTALVQLGALRLNTDRSFLSLLDGRNQYIVAEATRHHSLKKADKTVFLGVSKLDISFGVCPKTIEYFNDDTGKLVLKTENMVADRRRYIINDFRVDPDYNTRPYVTGFPHMVSYAEVPLVSPLGYVLGSYCVVDDKLREFDNDATIDVLNEVAASIMTHLDLIRLKQSRTRAELLIRGLTGFIASGSRAPPSRDESLSDFKEIITESLSPEVSEASEVVPKQMSAVPQIEPLAEFFSSSSESASGGSGSESNGQSFSPTMTEENDMSSTTPSTIPRDVKNPISHPQILATPNSSTFEATQESTPSSDIGNTFSRAATTIREAMNLDGVIFLDAFPTGFGQLWNRPTPDNVAGQISQDVQAEVAGVTDHSVSCEMIASSLGVLTESQTQIKPENSLSEAALQRLIRRYPKGHVFSADELGPIDDRFGPGNSFRSSQNGRRQSTQFNKVVEDLFTFLPGARYVIFLPIWHFQRETWYGATLGWVTDPTQTIIVEDLDLLSAFGNSIMAEVSRMEALAVSRAKSDFISSISHELRSPLHGILASGELLRESIHDPALLANLDMIESCGRTLLDTFNNLLDYAKINRVVKSHKSGSNLIANGSSSTVTMSKCDLSRLVQEVVDSVHLGFMRTTGPLSPDVADTFTLLNPQKHDSEAVLDQSVLVTMNIEQRPEWIMDLDVGSWKRIVMNLLGKPASAESKLCLTCHQEMRSNSQQ
jgi:signal transduction histidine kinase/GAF domain-containing protein